MRPRRTTGPWWLLPALLTAWACRGDRDAQLLVVVTADGSPPAVAALEVTLRGPAGASTARYDRADERPIVFPTTLAATLPARATGEVTLEVEATDAAGATIATGRLAPFPIGSGERKTVYVQLDCDGGPCRLTGGGSGDDGGVPEVSPRCGNGRIDPGESCDIAIQRGNPGACPPPGCNDGIACTEDIASGEGCTARCAHDEITQAFPGDGCCPAGKTLQEDADCSAGCGNGTVDPGELCDKAIAAGAPGACPTACPVTDPCLTTVLISAGNCSAVCARYPVAPDADRQMTGDGCCPPGGTNASDRDCPVVCGNGIKEDGESCDVAIPAPAPGSCQASCEDGDSCTVNFLAGSGCQAACVRVDITDPISGDGCCPPTANSATDTDCPATCGNGVLDRGEACDPKAEGAAKCPCDPKLEAAGVVNCQDQCPPGPSECLPYKLEGRFEDCSQRCILSPITACSGAETDFCCPSGCDWATDADCPITCGDAVIQYLNGEKCDIAEPGSCPTSCSSPDVCTEARLVSAGTCTAECVWVPITAPRAGDGCCPDSRFTLDPDCPASCGDGVVDWPAEPCDHGVDRSCPTPELGCVAADACTRVSFTGSRAICTARCIQTPITDCVSGDDCCAPGCSAATDTDCPVVCGDGLVSPGERCDRALPAGSPGACPRSCDDGNACTIDVASGSVEGCSRTCSNHPITACVSGDGCCPTGCSAAGDLDCDSRCNDGRIGAGETCDPMATCPTTCPDDGDPCTVERLTGNPRQCDVVCRHEPRTTCSGATADRCCPAGCTPGTDSDC